MTAPRPDGRPPRRLGWRVLGGRLGAQWERDRRETLFLLGAVLLSVLPQFGWLPPWCSAGFMLLVCWRLGLLFAGRALPGHWTLWGASACALFATWAQYRTLIGRDQGVVLLVLFLGVKLLEMRARRDLFVIIFLCCFLLVTGYLQTQAPWMAAATLLAVLTLIASMLTMQFRDDEMPVARRLRFALVLMLQALPVAAAMFVLFPRPAAPLWGAGERGSSSSTGLSDSMAPGDIAELANSDAVVMRVDFDGAVPPPASMYWRGPTFGVFDGRAWHEMPRRALADAPRPAVHAPRRTPQWRYTATLEPGQNPWLLALDLPTAPPVPDTGRIEWMPTYEFVRRPGTIERLRYSAQARGDATIGADDARGHAAWLDRFTMLPAGFNPRTDALIAGWKQQSPEPQALVDRALAWFHTQPYRYTFTPPKLGRDSVDDFLFETRAGFCEHYSSAFVVMMRSAGLAARVVTGYQGGEPSGDGRYWIIRQADAHAWAEVWIAGRGWQRVDPTAAIAPERIERGARVLRGQDARDGQGSVTERWARRWQLGLDWVSHSWNDWVLSYGASTQVSLLSRLGLDFTDWHEVAAVVAAAFAMLLAAFALGSVRRRAPRHPVDREFARFCDRLATLGVVRMPHETPAAYLDRADRLLDHELSLQAREIVGLYHTLRYDRDTGERTDALRLRRLVRAFRP